MHSTLRRLSKLEKTIGGSSGMLIVVHAGPNDTQIDEVLRERGFDRNDPKHRLVIQRTVYERKDGSIEPDFPTAQITHVGPLDKRVA